MPKLTTHLLSLAAMDAAASGVLDVVFGPDGDFEGAPPARLTVFVAQPVWTERGERPGTYGVLVGPDPDQSGWWLIAGVMEDPRLVISLPESNLALDLRVPSVAAWIAALIQRVGGDTGDDMIAEAVVNNLSDPRAIAELAPALAAHFRDPSVLARVATLRGTSCPS